MKEWGQVSPASCDCVAAEGPAGAAIHGLKGMGNGGGGSIAGDAHPAGVPASTAGAISAVFSAKESANFSANFSEKPLAKVQRAGSDRQGRASRDEAVDAVRFHSQWFVNSAAAPPDACEEIRLCFGRGCSTAPRSCYPGGGQQTFIENSKDPQIIWVEGPALTRRPFSCP
jgi:hypothetical protein